MRKSSRFSSRARSIEVWSCAICLVVSALAPVRAQADVDPATGRAGGDVAARSFSEYCAGALPPDRRGRFDAAFADAEAALLAGRVAAAEQAMGRAFEAAYRGDADTEISIKCLGEPIARRWWKARLEIDRQRGKQASSRHPHRESLIRVAAADQGSQAVVTLVTEMRPERFVASVRRLESAVYRLDADRRFGAFMLAEEEEFESACREALEELRRHAAEQHRSALATEAPIFDRPITDRERTASDMANDAGALVDALAGEALDAGIDSEVIVLRNRVRESRELLRAARTWNLSKGADQKSLPSSIRAKQRGDEMNARANQSDASLDLQASSYDAAVSYYEFGGFDEESRGAATARAKLEDGLRARRAERDAKLERAADRMKQEAEAAKRSVEDMRKSESEKKAFDDEAKALEDELGF